jgi:hypothetical protein
MKILFSENHSVDNLGRFMTQVFCFPTQTKKLCFFGCTLFMNHSKLLDNEIPSIGSKSQSL